MGSQSQRQLSNWARAHTHTHTHTLWALNKLLYVKYLEKWLAQSKLLLDHSKYLNVLAIIITNHGSKCSNLVEHYCIFYISLLRAQGHLYVADKGWSQHEDNSLLSPYFLGNVDACQSGCLCIQPHACLRTQHHHLILCTWICLLSAWLTAEFSWKLFLKRYELNLRSFLMAEHSGHIPVWFSNSGTFQYGSPNLGYFSLLWNANPVGLGLGGVCSPMYLCLVSGRHWICLLRE